MSNTNGNYNKNESNYDVIGENDYDQLDMNDVQNQQNYQDIMIRQSSNYIEYETYHQMEPKEIQMQPKEMLEKKAKNNFPKNLVNTRKKLFICIGGLVVLVVILITIIVVLFTASNKKLSSNFIKYIPFLK